MAASLPSANAARSATPAGAHRIDHTKLLYDEPGDGSLWVRGQSYKASFDAAGATYYPALGARAPQNYPHALSPDRASIGGVPLALDGAARATRNGDHVAFDRGAFIEAYDLAPQSVEQSFVFSSLPRGGDLVLHVPIACALAGVQTNDAIEFGGELGRVAYGRATAIDAQGRRTPAVTRLEDGAITIRVDESYLRTAALPLVIDPLVSTIFFPGAADVDDFAPDTAYDPTQNGWLVVWSETFTATDHDVYCQFLSATGAVLLNGTIDLSSSDWTSPRCANVAAAQQYLAVAGVTFGPTKSVMGRTAKPNGSLLTMSSQFTISDGSPGDKINPDVGGDPFLSLPSHYCVVYEQVNSTSDHRIEVRMVDPNAVVQNGSPAEIPIEFGSPDITPSVSKSDDATQWVLAWTRVPAVSHGDIWAAHVSFSGFLLDGPFGITATLPSIDFAPCASSAIHSTHRSVITFGRTFGANRDIMIAAIDGTNVLEVANLTQLENTGNSSLDQIESSVDSNVQHFVVTYSEGTSPGPYTVYADDLALSDTTLELAETHVLLHQFGLSERRSNVCGAHRLNGPFQRLMAVYDYENNPTDHDVAGALFDAIEGGSSSTFCGNATGQAIACPCGLNGTLTNGCPNSANSSGAHLSVSGILSTLDDTASLHATGVPGNASCIFLQGTATNGGVVFGDGVRCTTGTLIRLAVKNASLGQVTYPSAGDPSVSVRGGVPVAGGLRAYQVWYRDNNQSFCTSQTFNISSGVIIQWAP